VGKSGIESLQLAAKEGGGKGRAIPTSGHMGGGGGKKLKLRKRAGIDPNGIERWPGEVFGGVMN